MKIGVAEAAVSIHIVEALPDHPLLLQEALVRHQQVEVALKRRERGQLALASVGEGCPSARRKVGKGLELHLVLYHGAEVVVTEEDAELALPDGGGKLAEPMVGQLGGCGLQELLCHQPWGESGVGPGPGRPHPALGEQAARRQGGLLVTFAHQAGVTGLFAGDDLLHQLVVAQLAHSLHHLRALQGGEGPGG